jgi:hypothetical protein
MVAVASCFAQILSLIDRAGFARAVRQHHAERAAKGFGCWDHFVAMLFCQMGSAHSLREICGGLATSLGKRVHLGVRRTPTRSTLAYANAHRPWPLYETLVYQVLTQCQVGAAAWGETVSGTVSCESFPGMAFIKNQETVPDTVSVTTTPRRVRHRNVRHLADWMCGV